MAKTCLSFRESRIELATKLRPIVLLSPLKIIAINVLASGAITLEELVTNDDLRHTLSRNAESFASRFSAENMALKTLKVYERLAIGNRQAKRLVEVNHV